jgi:hypothetical protein
MQWNSVQRSCTENGVDSSKGFNMSANWRKNTIFSRQCLKNKTLLKFFYSPLNNTDKFLKFVFITKFFKIFFSCQIM